MSFRFILPSDDDAAVEGSVEIIDNGDGTTTFAGALMFDLVPPEPIVPPEPVMEMEVTVPADIADFFQF